MAQRDAICMDLTGVCHGSAIRLPERWTDGPENPQVIFDGPVDALWIEPGVAEGNASGKLEDLH